MIALRPLSALMMLFAGVAAGIGRRRDRGDDADRARDLDRGRARDPPRSRRPTSRRCRSRSRPIVLRRFFAILSATLPRPVSRTARLGERAIARRLDDRPAGGGDNLVDALLRPAVGDALRDARAQDELANHRRRLIVCPEFLVLHRRCLHR